MPVLNINHVSLVISNCEQSKQFYADILDLQPSLERPNLSFSGIWYQIGAQQIHLLEVNKNTTQIDNSIHGGRDNHLALNVDNLDHIISLLEQKSIAFSLSHSGRKALFFRDPDDNILEIIESE